MNLKGYVDRADALLIEGWALDAGDPDRAVAVHVEQHGRELMRITPSRPSKDVVAALGVSMRGPPRHRWRIAFPLAQGLLPDEAFSVRFSETGQALDHGSGKRIALLAAVDTRASADLASCDLLTPDFRFEGGMVHVGMLVYRDPGQPAPEIEASGSVYRTVAERSPPIFGKTAHYARVRIGRQDCAAHFGAAAVSVLPPSGVAGSLRSELLAVSVPLTAFPGSPLIAPVPANENLARISGPSANGLSYLIRGATTWRQLDLITRHYFERPLDQFESIVDWGCGAARVLRQFLEYPTAAGRRIPKVLGLDIDPVNVEWCRRNLPAVLDVRMLGLDGFDLPDESIDMLYGISVMTHLTERHQEHWLAEIRRVTRPGACIILTTHGEYATYRNSDNLAIPFVDTFGFFDAIPDPAIGAERQTYYRTTYQSRANVLREWSRHLEVLDVVPARNAFIQDFVVLRRR